MKAFLVVLSTLLVSCWSFVSLGTRDNTRRHLTASSGASSTRWQTTPTAVHEPRTSQDKVLYQLLCRELGLEGDESTYLKCSKAGIRGVHVSQPFRAGDVVFAIPLSSPLVLRDDESPLETTDTDADDDDADFSSPYSNRWASRLAAAFLAKQSSPDRAFDLYLSILPDPAPLAATLPLNWKPDVLTLAGSTALELCVDSAFFARADTVEDVLQGTHGRYTREQVQYALDLVQTRSCRLDLESGEQVRCLVPVFDMINHSVFPNAEFVSLENALVVKAVTDLNEGDQLLIDYGDSARPASRCLASYGFVPEFHPDDDSAAAEVYMNGLRFEVGQSSIPEAMVTACMADAAADGESMGDSIPGLNPEIASRLGQRLSDVALQLLLDPLDENRHDPAAPELSSVQLAKSLRWYQHRVLMACAKGLRDWATEQEAQT